MKLSGRGAARVEPRIAGGEPRWDSFVKEGEKEEREHKPNASTKGGSQDATAPSYR